ncbi:MAG: hypothetical protein K0R03_865 [Moraxellaceae bacterium]|jgi:copper(I)-binding protein|nr:hypothetical protein [Moraxellaceae bacterium]
MRKMAHKTLARVIAAVLLLLAAATAAGDTAAAPSSGGAVVVMDAWVGEAPPAARNLAVYLTLKNGPRNDTLLSVKTPLAAAAELHQTRKADGVTRMQKQSGITLAPGEEVQFAPGGRHVMLIGVKRALKVGDRVPLTLKFRRAGNVDVQAEVRPLQPDASGGQADPHAGHRH